MTTYTSQLVLPVGDRDHIRGPVTAPVTLVEYGDYQCPFCGLAHPIVEEVRRRLGNKVRFVYRHFPMSNAHPRAEPAAEAAEAAGAQGKFWEMHDTLFEHQDALEDPDLLLYARRLQLDRGRFARELRAAAHAPKIREDFLSGVRSGVNGTPTFYINDFRHDGQWDAASLLRAIQERIADY